MMMWRRHSPKAVAPKLWVLDEVSGSHVGRWTQSERYRIWKGWCRAYWRLDKQGRLPVVLMGIRVKGSGAWIQPEDVI